MAAALKIKHFVFHCLWFFCISGSVLPKMSKVGEQRKNIESKTAAASRKKAICFATFLRGVRIKSKPQKAEACNANEQKPTKLAR